MSARTRLAGLLAAGALLLTVAGPVAAADGDAMVRVLHGSPDTPSVDVYVNDGKVDALSGLEFGDLSEYVAVPPGTYAIKVCATADPTLCPIDVPALDLAADTMYTIGATNVLASIEAQVLVDEPNPTADQAQVRVVHFSADTPAVDVLTQDGSATIVDALAYPNATDYLSLDGGSYDLKVCADADNTVCPLDPGALDLANGTAYSVFAIGSLDGQTLTAAVGVDATYEAPAPEPTAAPGDDDDAQPTPPPTDTVAGTGSTDGSLPFAATLLGLAAIAGLALGARYATVRARDR